MADDLISIIFTQPWIYFVIVSGIVGFVLIKWFDKKNRPEQKPFWGKEVRDNMTNKIISKRTKVWGDKSNYKITKGFTSIGKALNIESMYKFRKDDKGKPTDDIEEYYLISFRNFGLWNWIKSQLGRYEYLLIDPKAVKISDGEKLIVINPTAFILDNSGIWTLATKKDVGLIDDLNLKVDIENTLGFSTDFARRLSNQAPSQAIYTERQEQEAGLEEQARRSKISSWIGKR